MRRTLASVVLAAALSACGVVILARHPVKPNGGAPVSTTTTTTVQVPTKTGIYDPFNGTTLNPALWTAETRPVGYRNGELQSYSPSQVEVKDGALQITALRTPTGWISGEVDSKWQFTYGTFTTKFKIVGLGQGVWPAAWLNGRNGKSPNNGELDYMENVDNRQSSLITVHGALPDGKAWQRNRQTWFPLDQWNTYSVVKTATYMTVTIDGHLEWKITRKVAPADGTWPYDDNVVYNIFDIAISSRWGGPPTVLTPGRIVMSVDFVKVTSAT